MHLLQEWIGQDKIFISDGIAVEVDVGDHKGTSPGSGQDELYVQVGAVDSEG